MKIVLSLIFLIFSNLIFSNEFKYINYKNQDREFHIEVLQLISHFEGYNFNRTNPYPNGVIPVLNIDEVMTSINGKGQIFIKYGLVTKETDQNKVMELQTEITKEKFYIYNLNNISVAFFNLSKDEVELLTRNLSNKKTSFLKNLFIESAYAETTHCKTPASNDQNTKLQTSADSIEFNLITTRISECAINAFKGAENSITGTYDFFKTAITNPGKMWEQLKNSYEVFKTFITNFSQEFKNIYEILSSLDLDQKLEIACTMTGEITTSIAMTMIAGGAAVKTANLFASYLPKLKRIERISKMMRRNKQSFKKAGKLLTCEI